MATQYEIVIGLEVHSELKTASKIFCCSSTEFGGDPNTHICPVCLGLPGVLPVTNKKVVEFGIKAGLALNCTIAEYSKFDRKNYYYPDLPKNYQISQYDLPIAEHGYLDITVDGQQKRIGITRVHMEEDAGKLVHEGETMAASRYSLVDYNRTGVPLVEIVSEPEISSPEEARLYLEKMKAILQYTEVSDCKMEEGSLRCDANISVRPVGQKEFGTRTELKNMNSFRALQKALEYEAERQIEVLEDGGRVIQETRTWDEARGITLSMRSKEEAHDYRYFPDPDLVPMVISPQWIEEIRQTLPELPDARKERYARDYALPLYDAEVITGSKELSDYFDEGLKYTANAKALSNWVMGELLKYINTSGMSVADFDFPIPPANLAELIELIDSGDISGKIAKDVFAGMQEKGERPSVIIEARGLKQISDAGAIAAVIDEVIAKNPQSVEDFRNGKDKAIGFLVGQVMKATKGQANPGVVNQLLRDKM
ncbi:Asp-tRNA(Asn)/Glu-tRNA(Gln) amidotransferase subunit GatB [Phosphitispora fastidiosa]|uniref:Asp-tRNA(Asn)/Glu-tRNA(Gln) amidotransferase subunit GatB n=1 Tax=Phosphitispora fastidiosa TaxID=2837202 RepID=UPI001E3A0A67|nr:Asp-tRNA(Asn)/Glu-tRNA(Gln) amidotransferase subunit GatB [Phosphitispora fastidiosa]MBU7008679.1 aspartyl-tRNA(Asn)/glutamyl-tRNA(Gln) amidotransferase subunit B [Phosphitispora fastidiosa]